MRLYSGKISPIAKEIVIKLTESGDIDVEQVDEVIHDLEAVLKEYLRTEKEIIDEAKTRMEREGLSYSMLSKVRSQISKERKFPPQDEFLPYIIEQLLEMLFYSANVNEVYADDVILRTKITPILRQHLEVDEALDREVRSRIKNLQEGTAAYEIEYQKTLDIVKRKKRLEPV